MVGVRGWLRPPRYTLGTGHCTALDQWSASKTLEPSAIPSSTVGSKIGMACRSRVAGTSTSCIAACNPSIRSVILVPRIARMVQSETMGPKEDGLEDLAGIHLERWIRTASIPISFRASMRYFSARCAGFLLAFHVQVFYACMHELDAARGTALSHKGYTLRGDRPPQAGCGAEGYACAIVHAAAGARR
jgi:hypothetical protein